LSCEALAGDLYLAHAGDDGLVLAVSDVVGHGVSAAMYAGMLRSTLDAARRRSPEPKALIGELLDGIDFFDAAKYATLFYGLLLLTDALDALLDHIRRHCAGRPLDDDVTLLLVERTGELPAGSASGPGAVI